MSKFPQEPFAYYPPSGNKHNIWMYWENINEERLPAYLKLCIEILRKKCRRAQIHIVTPKTLFKYLPDINVIFHEIKLNDLSKNSIALKADYIRVKLLYEYGGVWQDIDCIALNDYSTKIIPLLNQYDFVCMKKLSKDAPYVSNNFMATKARGAIISEYLLQIENYIELKKEKNESYEWAELGAKMLTPIVDGAVNEGVFFFDEKHIHPFDYTEASYLEAPHKDIFFEDRVNNNTICVMLYHSLFSAEWKALTRSEIINSELLAAQIFRYALGYYDSDIKDCNITSVRKKIEYMDSRNYWGNLVENELLWVEKYNTFYAACSKCACSTVKGLLSYLVSGQQLESYQSPHDRSLTGFAGLKDLCFYDQNKVLHSAEVFRFAFVRNPFDRIISCYLNRIDNLGLEPYDLKDYSTQNFIAVRKKILAWKCNENIDNIDASKKITFRDFVEFICDQEPFEMDRHWYFQSRSIHYDVVEYDFIGKVENFNDDMKVVFQRMGGFPSTDWLNIKLNVTKKFKTRDFFDNNLRDKFVNKFIEDFDNFDYPKKLF